MRPIAAAWFGLAIAVSLPHAAMADEGCLAALTHARIPFVRVGPTRGLRTPLLVTGPIGSLRLVHMEPRDSRRALMACELVRALSQAEPVFKSLGITDLLYSEAYDYRTRHGSHRLSEHAHGLAIDVHRFRDWRGNEYSVARDYPLDDEQGRVLRTLASQLSQSGQFRLILTPADNADHWNHFHLEAFPSPMTAVARRAPRR